MAVQILSITDLPARAARGDTYSDFWQAAQTLKPGQAVRYPGRANSIYPALNGRRSRLPRNVKATVRTVKGNKVGFLIREQ